MFNEPCGSRSCILILLVVAGATFLYSYLLCTSQHYYSFEEPFGPLSNLTILVLYIAIVTMTFISSIFILRGFRSAPLAAMIVVIVIMVKYMLPQYFDNFYVQNFYDAGGHVLRGAFVSITGHSDPRVDAYFDVQPGFFWWTAIFVNVVFGPQYSLNSVVFEFFMKWFNIIALILYLPILSLLFKKLKLSSKSLLIGYAIFVLVSYLRFHYSAQAFSWAFHWLILAINIGYMELSNTRNPRINSYIVSSILLTALIFIHQGTTLFTVVTLMALLFHAYTPSIAIQYHSVKRYLMFSLIFLISSWLAYLMYHTIYTFSNFLRSLTYAVEEIMNRGIVDVVVRAVARPYEVWFNIVQFKAVYMMLVIALLIVSLLVRFVKGDKIAGALLSYVIALSTSVGIVALALGGAGYVERIYEALTPLIALMVLTIMENAYTSDNKRHHLALKSVLTVAFTVLVVIGSVLYFSGWNFQSITYSEWYVTHYLRDFLPDVAGVYLDPSIRIQKLFYPEYPYKKTVDHNCLLIESHHNNIQAIYYLLGDLNLIENARLDILQDKCIIKIYSSTTTSIFFKYQ